MYVHPQRRSSRLTQKLRREAGRLLRELREKRGLSQRQLAGKVGAEYYTFISQLERGQGRIPPDRYLAWARALGVKPRRFVRALMSYYDPVTYDMIFGGEARLDRNNLGHGNGDAVQMQFGKICRARTSMPAYEQPNFGQIATAIGIEADQIAKHENLFDAAALWYRLNRRRPTRIAPSKLREILDQIAKSARRLLKSLGVNALAEAADGPDDPEILMLWSRLANPMRIQS